MSAITILDRIVATKREEVARARANVPESQLRERLAAAPPVRDFLAALARPGAIRLIAEVKKASPSKGVIRADFEPVAIARTYQEHGAACLSVLTDEQYFQGSLDYLRRVREAVELPVLRKDFVIDPYQVLEARVAGADAVLLIAECLTEGELVDMLILAQQLQLTTLLEVHSMESLLRVRPHVGFPHPAYGLLGINNRDLSSMTVDLSHTLRLLDLVEDTTILVSESGISSAADIRRLRTVGVRIVLVGEHLMRQPDPGEALKSLLGPAR